MTESLQPRDGPDDRRLYVACDEAERGSEGPFYVVYAADTRGTRWGYFCANCETFDNAMDAMGRVQCNVCSNFRRPEEWDAAHE